MTDYERGYYRAVLEMENKLHIAYTANQLIKKEKRPRKLLIFSDPILYCVAGGDEVIISLLDSIRTLRP